MQLIILMILENHMKIQLDVRITTTYEKGLINSTSNDP